MREKIAQWLWCQEAGYTWSESAVSSYETELAMKTYGGKADQILSLIREEIKKSLLTAGAIHSIKRLKYSPDMDEAELFMVALRGVAQAQLDEILKALES